MYVSSKGYDAFPSVFDDRDTQGMMHMDEWGSLRYASGAAFGASLYYEVTGDTSARDLALSQLTLTVTGGPWAL